MPLLCVFMRYFRVFPRREMRPLPLRPQATTTSDPGGRSVATPRNAALGYPKMATWQMQGSARPDTLAGAAAGRALPLPSLWLAPREDGRHRKRGGQIMRLHHNLRGATSEDRAQGQDVSVEGSPRINTSPRKFRVRRRCHARLMLVTSPGTRMLMVGPALCALHEPPGGPGSALPPWRSCAGPPPAEPSRSARRPVFSPCSGRSGGMPGESQGW